MNKTAQPTTRLSTSLAAAILIATASSAVSVQALAGNGHTDLARVTDVEPIYRTIAHRTPERSCWTETVAYSQPVGGRRSHTGTLLGTLIGGAIGNRVGHNKTNKKVGAVAGALLGASIGRDIGNKSRSNYSTTQYRDQERCEVTEQVSYEEKITGYRVTYKYHGNTYHTRMDEHPGKKIKVAVNVRPVY